MSKTVTLVVHGTYAADAAWWRLGADGEATFADRLETELARRGLAGTVWRPWLEEGFEAFVWSGRNRHRDRVAGARKLSASLDRFAQNVEATPDEPVTVNLVAHSHGGNVVLEALTRLRPNVRVGRVVLLGTPLATVRPAFRLARFAFSAVLLGFLFLGFLVFAMDPFVSAPEGVQEGFVMRWLGPILVAYGLGLGWLFWFFGNLLDVAWRAVCRLFQPILWLRGKAASLLYGPSPPKLAEILDAPPILLLTSYNDEADLLLRAGSGPATLYRDFAATFSRWGRALELAFLRPLMLGVFLKAAEMFLERVSLGVPIWRSLFFDHTVAPLRENPYYPRRLLVQERLDLRPTAASLPESPDGEEVDAPARGSGQPRRLHLSLKEVTDEIKRQVRLRHSAYYENEEVVVRIAELVSGEPLQPAAPPQPSPTLKPPTSFWEALLVGNVALAVLLAWVAQDPRTWGLVLGLFSFGGYAVPAVVFGLLLALHGAVRRRLPARPWRWFWWIWSVVWLLGCLVALSLRFDT